MPPDPPGRRAPGRARTLGGSWDGATSRSNRCNRCLQNARTQAGRWRRYPRLEEIIPAMELHHNSGLDPAAQGRSVPAGWSVTLQELQHVVLCACSETVIRLRERPMCDGNLQLEEAMMHTEQHLEHGWSATRPLDSHDRAALVRAVLAVR